LNTVGNKPMVYFTSLLFIFFSFFSYRSYDPLKHDPPNDMYSIVVKRLNEQHQPNDYPLVIVHKSLAEMIIYETSFDALNWNPPTHADTDKILRIVSNLELFHFSKYLDRGEMNAVRKLSQQYYLMDETTWRVYLDRVYASNDANILELIHRGKNPIKDRPEYLTKGKKL
ncbi:MAG: hypothetical protein AAF551_11215, partial [Bacteroidota bacterium]